MGLGRLNAHCKQQDLPMEKIMNEKVKALYLSTNTNFIIHRGRIIIWYTISRPECVCVCISLADRMSIFLYVCNK